MCLISLQLIDTFECLTISRLIAAAHDRVRNEYNERIVFDTPLFAHFMRPTSLLIEDESLSRLGRLSTRESEIFFSQYVKVLSWCSTSTPSS
jgi:hypothetical protein